ncbi:MAG TPA: glycogen debranching protein, partial [Chitinophagaceae bacterium]|nr:glycogen debranching protein [Chitinophagaceae bacterium]
ETPDIFVDFKRKNNKDIYIIKQRFKKNLHLKLILPVYQDAIAGITVNSIPAKWKMIKEAVGKPLLQIDIDTANRYSVQIMWEGKNIEANDKLHQVMFNKPFHFVFSNKELLEIFDPQKILNNTNFAKNKLTFIPLDNPGYKTFFIKVKQGIAEWWQPFNLHVMSHLSAIHPGKMRVSYPSNFEKIDLKNYYNDKVANIFKQQYLSPRPKSPTLQLPTQGIGNWCYPLTTANINDAGLRKLAGANNEITSPKGIPFSTPSDTLLNNIVFTSQWDNYPKHVSVPLTGVSSHIYFLMAGSTNPMQSRITNGLLVINYTDGTGDTLLLKNPENWWPIEQDYINDGYAFTVDAPMPLRFYLQQGKFAYGLKKYSAIKGFTNMAIDGGAATQLDMSLNASKELKSLTVETLANDVVIGLMSVTLQRK